MPTSEKQRRAVFAEMAARKKGKKAKNFKGMDDAELKDYSDDPLHKKGDSKKKFKKLAGRSKGKGTAGQQAKALRGGY